uniref:20 kDa chaperonin, chloroplastic n=1 Tax=Brassica campestris TaxID=3711 RepID=M4CQU3_BRACM
MAATQLTSSPVTVSARSFSELRYASIKPLGDLVLVKIKEAEEKTYYGRLEHAGTEVEFNGEKHLILKEDDIVGLLETEDIKDLKPLNDRVFIKVAEAEEKTAGGLLLTETTKEKPSIGTVIAVGPGTLDEEGKVQPLSISIGSTVLILEDGGPPRAPPASKEVVEKLPVIVFSEEMLKTLGADVECCIRKENLDEHNSCPICRHALPTDDQKYESWKEREKEAIDKIFKDDASEEKGERARMASFIGAMAVADLVKSTLGPKGMDKILQSTGRGHSVTVTNDGATILKSLHIDNPAAKVLVDISKVQDDEVGDGTTSVVVLAGELLREAEKLVTSKIHPMTIIAGYRMAAECARDALLKRVIDNKENAEKFRSDLMKIAMTTLCSKILSQDKEHFAEMAVDAVFRLKGSTNLEAIQIIKKPGGSLRDSFLDEGFILDKKIGIGQPKRIENAKILVANTAMDTDKVKIYGARVRVDSMTKVAQIEGAEKEKMKDKVNKILAHGINCFVNRQLIYNFPEELFADAGVLAIEHADFEGIERLGLVTGGEIASTFDNPESVKLGHCKLIEEIMIGEDKLIHFSGVEMGQACSIVLRGASHHVLDEAERSLHDALCVLSQTVNDSRVLLGGGWPEMVMAKEVDELARKTAGKKSHAIEAFSRALVAIPTKIADNAGLDSAELVAQLRAEHHTEGCNAGIDVISGAVGDMEERGIYEAFKVKQAVLLSATEAAEMILRVDEIITCAPRRREDRM